MKSLNGKQTLVRFAVLIAFTLAIAAVAAQAQNSKTQSLINEIKAEFPERQKQISEGCGGASVMVDVDFASFGDNYDALLKVPQQGLKETANGFRRHCTNSNRTSEQDPAKVDAVKSKVKKVVIKHVAKPEQKNISLQADGVVLVEMSFGQAGGGLG
ncbi:MAG: hypothetical protein WKF30_19285, partial [Pyrinomonadaceae bacterium]